MMLRLALVAFAVAAIQPLTNCTRALNSQSGLPAGRDIKARDIPSADLVSICETGVATRGEKFNDPASRAELCNYAGILYAGESPDPLSERVEKDMEKAMRLLNKACELGSANGCNNIKVLSEN